mmetsp:Transcript_32746/g.59343  ORF Transcript_32746/g.59343 Transcript_32746/m.59343 type:complete len:87 (+) Transcript_32746:357-617(+)
MDTNGEHADDMLFKGTWAIAATIVIKYDCTVASHVEKILLESKRAVIDRVLYDALMTICPEYQEDEGGGAEEAGGEERLVRFEDVT